MSPIQNVPKNGQRGFQRTHGLRQSPEYVAWHHMKDRCNNPRNAAYMRYGGRGLELSARWESFEAFYADMGPKPPGTSLDRINNDLGYCKENCRWATPTEQSRNRSNTRRYGAFGEWLTLSEWEERVGLHKNTIQTRLRSGWSLERALTTPAANRGQQKAA